jgi:hypothetical protein
MTMTMTGTPEMQDYGGNYEAPNEVVLNSGLDISRIIVCHLFSIFFRITTFLSTRFSQQSLSLLNLTKCDPSKIWLGFSLLFDIL